MKGGSNFAFRCEIDHAAYLDICGRKVSEFDTDEKVQAMLRGVGSYIQLHEARVLATFARAEAMEGIGYAVGKRAAYQTLR